MEDQEIIMHFFHEHPLRRLPNVVAEIGWDNYCFGCWRFFLPGEAAYGCSVKCGYGHCLHEECLEMAREIRHPMHPSHQLTLTYSNSSMDGRCAICDDPKYSGFFYVCIEGCEKFWFHLGCVGGMEVLPDEQLITHPSHQHQLRFWRRKKTSCAFECDACGKTEKGNSYICTICQYWIHERCVALPTTMRFDHHQDHPLSLAFHLPYEYWKYEYTCSICNGALRLRHWIYHCKLCRYVVHIDCANKTPPIASSNTINNENADEDKEILRVPIDDMYEETIKPFVERQKGETSISHHDDAAHYEFHRQDHPLSFTIFSFSSSSRDNNEEEQESDDDDDVSELRCDACTTPIKKKSGDEGYMSCGECKYFLHLACFNLPPLLPSHPLHQIEGHKLSLGSPPSNLSDSWYETNGLVYECTECSFKVDIKCASMPDSIKHAAHPQSHHYLKLVRDFDSLSFCVACYRITGNYYKCDKCGVSVCIGCVLLPARNKHRLDNHALPLTYDAFVNHPGEFYCSNCEEIMNPKHWMYHCRDCDQSFHPRCFPATSGEYRNINFGMQQYQVSQHPHHSLRFQIISKKKHCDVCHHECYDRPGYQCTSCNFNMCRYHDVQPMNLKRSLL